jgi:uncharacterized membrane-anchored protein YjiN (DUF445 family)
MPTMPAPDPSLRMQRIALALLAGAAVLYVAATALEPRHAAFAYVAAFAEAAMIGAVADWFAVVALFRHPLGLPIPHTAIVPANKHRIGANLARFIVDNFLGEQQLLERLQRVDAAGRLADWLAEPTHAEQVGRHLAAAARHLLGALDDERVRDFLRASVLKRLEQLDVSPLAGEVLDTLTAERRHHELLDEVLRAVAQRVQDDAVKASIADVIAADAKLLRVLGLDAVAANYAASRIAAGVSRTIAEMGDDPEHPLRLRFDASVQRFVERLKRDPALQAKGEAVRDRVLAQPALAAYLHGLWSELLAWLHDDLGRDDSTIRRRIEASALALGAHLRDDAAMRDWINAQLLAAAPPWIARYREQIGRTIVERVDAWNTEQLTAELERNIGRDLQFVRINGTLVGGLVGLAIHALTQWLR